MRGPVIYLDREHFKDKDVKRGPVPNEVLAYWRGKDLKPSFSYKDVWGQEHDQAFTAAKVMRVDVLNTLHKELEKAIEKGLPFAQWKKELEPKLKKLGWWEPHEVDDPQAGKSAKVNPPSRLRTIFDTNMRTARAVGQWERIQRTKKSRPYLLYQVGPSARHRPDHLSWHGILLPVDDPFWATHFAPNGWGCKCWIRTVSASEAEDLERDGVDRPVVDEEGQRTGEMERVPVIRTAPIIQLDPWLNDRTGKVELVPRGVDPGFHHRPGEGRRISLGDIPEVTTPPPPPPAPPGIEPQHWFDQEYGAKYGDMAGKAVAWGRAMQERGLDVSIEDAKRHLADFQAMGVTVSNYFGDLFEERGKSMITKDVHTLGQMLAQMEKQSNPKKWAPEISEVKALAALIGHRTSIATETKDRKFAVPRFEDGTPKVVKDRAIEVLARVKKFWSAMTHEKVDHADKSHGYVVHWRLERACFQKSTRTVFTNYHIYSNGDVDMGEAIIVHEMGHGMEEVNAWALDAAGQFLERRTQGEAARWLGPGYRDYEMTKEDKFFNPYVGKDYLVQGKRYATEVTSMATENVHRQAAQLMEEDPDCFYFALGQLAGAAKP